MRDTTLTASSVSWLVPARSSTPELMDRGDHSDADLAAALRDLGQINRWLGGRRALVEALRPHLAGSDRQRELEILDVGTGGADLPLAVIAMGRRWGREPRVTALDRNPRTARLAAARTGGCASIRVVCADATRLPFAPRSFDLVTASLFLHHFEESRILPLLRDFRVLARRAVVINDLRRHLLPWGFIWVLSRLARWHPMVRHDGPVSVLRGFTFRELERIGRASGIGRPRVRRFWPYRLVLELPAAGSP